MKLRQALLELPSALTASVWTASVLIVVVGFTGSLVLVFPLAQNAKLGPAEVSSWVWAICVGSGLLTLGLSLWYKQPVITAWSTPGLALLVTHLADYRLSDAVGAFVFSGLMVALLGWTGLFERAMRLVPQPVAMAVLGGVLLKFGLGLFTALSTSPVVVLAMVAAFLVFRAMNVKATMALALLVGVGAALALGQVNFGGLRLELAQPLFVWPTFNLQAIIGLGLPLLMLALASQNAPGFAVMQSFGYAPPARGSLMSTGLLSAAMAPMLSHGLTLAAITAALGNSPEAHPDPAKRYATGVVAGLVKTALGLFGATMVAFFAALPKALIAAMAGLALSGTIQNCLVGAFGDARYREAALFTLLLTASEVTFLGVGSAFWGLVAGVILGLIADRRTLT
ncbi:MAG: benzoate/H(+) symporter BenE family transporter [Meiothermus sp.]|nr:benzoate/H(+) symporter BenE family transporter [Meiothermus sp.]